MKNIYKSLMAVAAAFLLVPTAYAQTEVLEGTDLGHEKYLIDTDKGIGYNKYLTSTTPDGNGNYTLRIENFITGDVKATAVPTDFVLVIDNSGSMYYDYRPYGLTDRPLRIPLTDEGLAENSNEKLLLPYLVEGYGASDVSVNFQPYTGLTYNRPYQLSTVGTRVGTEGSYFYQTFYSETTAYGTNNRSTRYYRYEDSSNPSNNGYYRIFQKMNGSYYNLAIKLKDGTYRYLYGNTVSATPNSSIGRSDVIIYNGPNVYHVKSRQEALLEGVQSFVNLIAEENAKDQWKTGVTKHQVSVVSFSVSYPGGDNSPTITEYPTPLPSNDTKVIKSFGEVDNATTWYNYVKDRMTFRGGQTCIDYGVNLAKMLLTDLETNSAYGGKYVAQTSAGINRKKVVVVFTDGEPYDERTGQKRNYFQITNPCIKYGKTIKEVGVGKLNGRIYTIDLCMSASTTDFLDHLSFNYPKGDCTATSGNYSTGKFTGKKLPWVESDAASAEEWKYLEGETEAIYYKNTKDGDLSSVFSSIAAANTGAMSSTLVAVDVMSDSFKIPFTTEETDNVTMYTAQCIGKKKIDGEEYLAFAEPIMVKNRESLDELWVVRPVEGSTTGEKEWVNLAGEYGIDIDNKMKFKVIQETDENGVSKGKSIVVSGFNYADLWCGHDGEHNNTRQIENGDPNWDFQLDGYRGFKLIFEFPIKIDENALGGVNVPTNDWATSGLYQGDDNGNPQGNPEVNYPTPDLPVPVKLIIRKNGLQPGESANFTIERKLIGTDTWEDFATFVLTGDASNTPEIRFINLDASYYYKVKEGAWSWAYEHVSTEYTTENTTLTNPLVFNNTPVPTPKRAEAKAVNRMYTTESTTQSYTETINSK